MLDSGDGAPEEITNDRYTMEKSTARDVGLIEETKIFGPKGFRKCLVLEQSKSAFTNARSGKSHDLPAGGQIMGGVTAASG
jgi:hypothetical protein